MKQATLHCGDSSKVVPSLESGQFTACVCDPPYHLTPTKGGSKGFSGKTWDGGDIAFQPDFWVKILRVLKPGAMLLAFGAPRTFHRLTCAIEDGGFKVCDCLMWLYCSGFPKTLNVSKAIDKAAGAKREVIGVKPGHEGFANRKTKGHIEFKDGTEGFDRPWMHDDAKRAAYHLETAPNTEAAKLFDGYANALKPAWEPIVLAMKPLDGSFAQNALIHGVAGMNIGDSRTSAKGNWPANLLLDKQSGEMLDLQKDAASRFFYCPKATKRERTCGGKVENKHPTVKPQALMEYLCRLVTPPSNGIILDPFMGSGTTGLAAISTGNQFVGIELDPESFETARQRIKTNTEAKVTIE